jgi:hypothetical protein
LSDLALVGVGSIFVILTGTLATAEDRVATTQAAKAAGFLVGVDRSTWTYYNRCARVFPDRAPKFIETRDKVDRANKSIARLAKEKWLAAVEIQEGKAKRIEIQTQFDQMLFKELQQQTANQTQAELESICLGLLNSDPSKLFLSKKYPQEVQLMTEYHVGYPWSPPNCEYRVTFPHEPQISTTTTGGISTPKAETREEFGLPYIGALCVSIPASDGDLVDQLKRTGEQQARDIGVRNLRWKEESSSIGQRLTSIGETQRSGITVTMEKALWIGENSLLEVTVSDETEDYPSIETIQLKENNYQPTGSAEIASGVLGQGDLKHSAEDAFATASEPAHLIGHGRSFGRAKLRVNLAPFSGATRVISSRCRGFGGIGSNRR